MTIARRLTVLITVTAGVAAATAGPAAAGINFSNHCEPGTREAVR